jgi:hypothetical protein
VGRKHCNDYLAKFNAGDFEIVFTGYRMREPDDLLRFYDYFFGYVRESIAVDRCASDENTFVVEAYVRLECIVDLSPLNREVSEGVVRYASAASTLTGHESTRQSAATQYYLAIHSERG